jgi:hypothetical protein
MAHSARNANLVNTRNREDKRSTVTEFDRLEKESAKAYEAFALYRDLPPSERSLVAVSERLGKQLSMFKRWSAQFQWVKRATAWDTHQDRIRRTRLAAEREKTRERQSNNNRIASQALMAPILALAKRAQAKPDTFANVPAAELTKLAALSAKALTAIHRDERSEEGTPQDSSTPEKPVEIVGAEFTWVQGRCTCGHPWSRHDQSAEFQPGQIPTTPCTREGCECKNFVDADEDL